MLGGGEDDKARVTSSSLRNQPTSISGAPIALDRLPLESSECVREDGERTIDIVKYSSEPRGQEDPHTRHQRAA